MGCIDKDNMDQHIFHEYLAKVDSHHPKHLKPASQNISNNLSLRPSGGVEEFPLSELEG